ncbi:MAG TPA: hypothetical protein VES79_09125 [Solirubrobacteraceae bacterium]|nr:hypothetical protein [Solirubrobacteraceae bacterium]
MERSSLRRLWPSRLRWRMRGAWLWPSFVALTLADGILLTRLPFYGDGPGGVVPGVLLAGFANLFCVAVLAPFVGRRLRRRRPDLPKLIADDYAGTALVCLLAAGLLTAGLLHRPAVREEQADRRAQFAAVQGYVSTQAPEYRHGLGLADAMRLKSDLYRTCVPGPDPKRWLCLFVETDQHPAGLSLDSDRAPNDTYRIHGGFN